jgi:DNA-binding transcriptional regulator YiaG
MCKFACHNGSNELREHSVPLTRKKKTAGKVATMRHGKRPGTQRARGRVSKIEAAAYYRKAVSQKIPKVKVTVLRRELGLSQAELARVTGYSLRAIAGWEAGKPLSASARQKMVEAHRLREALAQIMPPNRLGGWMRTPNPAFEGQTPIQVIECGESDRLWRMIVQIDSNVAS